MTEPEIVKAITDRGWVIELPDADSLAEAVRAFQAFWGLMVDGRVGPVTERALASPQFCAVPEPMLADARRSVPKWQKTELRWHNAGNLPGLDEDTERLAYAEAWRYWEEVCGITAQHTEAESSCDVLKTSGRIDRAGGTLAWSELPPGDDRQLRQKYDTSEPWVVSEQMRHGRMDLVRVACHEIGHALGISHGPEGCLMAPAVSARIRRPQAWDIREARQRYGAPRVAPSPDKDLAVWIQQGDDKWQIQIEKVT